MGKAKGRENARLRYGIIALAQKWRTVEPYKTLQKTCGFADQLEALLSVTHAESEEK